MELLPPPLPGTALRILATSDLGAAIVPLKTSHGEAGTCAGIVALLERERERQPTVWLDVGDLVVGSPAYPLLGERPWDAVAALPIAATAAGNHEFDDGVDALLAAARTLGFPMLCANVDVGLPATAMLDTPAGPIGVIGLTNPASALFSQAPSPAEDWKERVAAHAGDLRAGGARWVVALLHDGVEWWPSDDGGPAVHTRADRLSGVAEPWAAEVDLILAGHNFAAWTGALGGTPAGEPHLFATSVLVADLAERPVVRGVFRVPATRPSETTPAVAAIDAAGERIVGELGERWLARTGAARYLPELIARGLRAATGANAGFVLPSFHGIQAPVDGAIAALGPGPVSELDLLRMVAAPDYGPVVVELEPGELGRAVAAHWATAEPGNRAGDHVWWNWCRMPAATSAAIDSPRTVAVVPAVVAHLQEWLGRDLDAAPDGVAALDALIAGLP